MESLRAVLGALCLILLVHVSPALAQINPGGYSCSADFTISQVLDTPILSRNRICFNPYSLARWYDLSTEPDFDGQDVLLRCVDFSVWSSAVDGDTEIFLRIYEDLSPEDGRPNLADRRFLREESILLPPSDEGVAAGTPPRSDGDISLELSLGGLRVSSQWAIIVEVGHEYNAAVRFGLNGDGNQTAPTYHLQNCAGPCGVASDYLTMTEFLCEPLSLVQQLHFDALDCANPGPSDDCNTNGRHDSCDFADGISFDCNSNGVPDDCDLIDGTSFDCNTNGIPDECEIASYRIADCNENGIPDECDISRGTSLDADGDGYPDDCGCFSDQFVQSTTVGMDEHFGVAVDIDGDVAVVGTWWNDNIISVYRKSGDDWTLEAELESWLPGAERLGRDVVVQGGLIAASVHFDTADGVLLFKYDESGARWIPDQEIMHSGINFDNGTMKILALDGNVLLLRVVESTNGGAPYRATVNVYRFDPIEAIWSVEDRWHDPNGFSLPTPSAYFGSSISLDGDLAAVAYLGNYVLVMRYNPSTGSWSEETTFTPEFGCGSNGGGYAPSVVVNGNRILIGVWRCFYLNDIDGEYLTGAVNVHRYDGSKWINEARLFPPYASMASGLWRISNFGETFTIENDVVAVVADQLYDQDYKPLNSIVFVYRHDGERWIADALMHPTIFTWGEVWPNTIAISGDTLIVGAPSRDEPVDDAGAVYFFSGLRNPDDDGNGLPDDCEFVIGDTNGDGIVDVWDLLDVLMNWGSCVDCSADINGDGFVNVLDLLTILSHWD